MATPPPSSVYKDPLHLTTGDQSLLQLLPKVFYDARYQYWIRTDYTVMRWIQFSLAEDISKSFSYEVTQIKQADLSVVEYYAKLRLGWEDIRSLDPLSECDCGAIATCTCSLLKKIVQRENTHHILDFLMGFHKKYDSIRSQILALDPLPTINQVYAKIHQAEVQMSITAVEEPNVWRRDNKKVRYDKPDDQVEESDKPVYYYTRCKKHGHNLEFCWVHKSEHAKKANTQQRIVAVAPVSTAASNGKKFAGHVEEVRGYEVDTPLDYDAPPVLDASFVQAIAKEIIDSGASDYMTYGLTTLHNPRTLAKPLLVTLPDGQVKVVHCVGEVKLSDKFIFHIVLFLPDFKHNLLSLGKLPSTPNLCANFHPTRYFIQDSTTKEILCPGLMFAGIYHLHSITKHNQNKFNSALSSNALFSAHVASYDVYLMHARLSHSVISTIKHVHSPNSSHINDKNFHCETCLMAKRHKSPFPISSSVTHSLFELIHVDLWGTYRVVALNGASYFLTIVDDYSRITWTMLLKHKYLACQTISHFLAYVKTQFNTTVKVLRSDNGTEILQQGCGKLLADHGIIHQTSIPGG
ncbi:uncharacterized protein LOC141589918 [Silene latifolia]|uniref:uncharacterized protein LOC141589918 n=1 Tax=Silene latifolia TaxID=37657 RepID=UPI003D76EA6C